MQLGLIEDFSDFKGTIVMPTEEAFSEVIAALDLDLTMEVRRGSEVCCSMSTILFVLF